MNEGRAFVYLGTPAGLLPSAAWTAESNQPAAEFGFSVASAGDVNGDGFSDVVVGASSFDNGEVDEGRAFVYLGGDGAPGASLGRIQLFGNNQFGPGGRLAVPARLVGRVVHSFFTHAPRFRLEAEAKPVGIAFNGQSTFLSPSGRGGTTIEAPLPVLPSGRYHWQARVVSGDSRGRWVPFGGNAESEMDFVVPVGFDAGSTDAGSTDAGPAQLAVGCGCQSGPRIEAMLALAGLLVNSNRRPRRRPEGP